MSNNDFARPTVLHGMKKIMAAKDEAFRDIVRGLGAEEQLDYVLNTASRASEAPRQLIQQLQASITDSQRYPLLSVEYLTRLFAAILLFFVTGYINALSSASAGWRTPYIQIIQHPGGEI